MKERPIPFSGAMVRALLNGSKTQTRRGVANVDPDGTVWKSRSRMYGVRPHTSASPDILEWCPYGQPGDRLWVREAWRSTGDDGRCDGMPPRDLQPHKVWHEADGPAPADECTGKLRPSMFMPRWASRITLEITSVRVERLQDISEADCWAEGIEEVMHDFDNASQVDMAKRLGCSIEDAKPLYAQLWEQINGPGSWDANPWVWAVEFRRTP